MQININMSAAAASVSAGSGARLVLSALAIGRRGRLLAVREPGAVGERILEMGLTPGTEVRVLRRSLLGGVLQVKVRDTVLSLRRSQADQIDVMPLDGGPPSREA